MASLKENGCIKSSSQTSLKQLNNSIGNSICAVMFDSTSIAVTWHRINGPCEPLQAGTAAAQLNTIKFSHKSGNLHRVFMIQNNSKEKMQKCLFQHPHNFLGIEKYKIPM